MNMLKKLKEIEKVLYGIEGSQYLKSRKLNNLLKELNELYIKGVKEIRISKFQMEILRGSEMYLDASQYGRRNLVNQEIGMVYGIKLILEK